LNTVYAITADEYIIFCKKVELLTEYQGVCLMKGNGKTFLSVKMGVDTFIFLMYFVGTKGDTLNIKDEAIQGFTDFFNSSGEENCRLGVRLFTKNNFMTGAEKMKSIAGSRITFQHSIEEYF